MDMFEKAAKAARNVSESVISSARNMGISLYSSTKEQGELASLNVQKSVIEKKLEDFYAEIGKRYVTYIAECDGGTAFDVADVLEAMQPQLDRLAEVKDSITEKELQIKQANEERAQKRAREEFDAEKERLDKALQMEIITEEDYTEKLESARRKLDHYDVLRKLRLQLEMGIISKEEYEKKVKDVLE